MEGGECWPSIPGVRRPNQRNASALISCLWGSIIWPGNNQAESFSHLGEGKLKRLINESSRWDRVVVNSTEGSVHKKINNLWHNWLADLKSLECIISFVSHWTLPSPAVCSQYLWYPCKKSMSQYVGYISCSIALTVNKAFINAVYISYKPLDGRTFGLSVC